jgi:hypothetical protein
MTVVIVAVQLNLDVASRLDELDSSGKVAADRCK